uniref:Uncharacterized protein n=1 Tax=Populus trichocarpa TaxID=3694 RepID=A0A2K1YVZ8_POPTR
MKKLSFKHGIHFKKHHYHLQSEITSEAFLPPSFFVSLSWISTSILVKINIRNT